MLGRAAAAAVAEAFYCFKLLVILNIALNCICIAISPFCNSEISLEHAALAPAGSPPFNGDRLTPVGATPLTGGRVTPTDNPPITGGPRGRITVCTPPAAPFAATWRW